ncbi:hypothetical protein SAMN04487979_102241 [Flavobacterium sp. ov086]|nr:hypothetical protein SAMN04487979_102241 [Flavobacterium sp. ov086]
MPSKKLPANLIKTSLDHGILLYQKATLFIKFGYKHSLTFNEIRLESCL